MSFNPFMLQSQKHNIKKVIEIGKEKIIQILTELSENGGIPRKRIIATNKAYPTHTEFAEKLEKLSIEELATALRRLSFLAQTKVYLFWKKENPDS